MSRKQAGIFSRISTYWSAFGSRLHAASWARVFVGCIMVLIVGAVLHLTTLAKFIVTISILNKLFLRHRAESRQLSCSDLRLQISLMEK
ncbi:hypothetical protein H8K32_19705 [Undibacterium jejuense]|uniref:Uncharacterized protein n=1 Tax=Undibacterium jejuense TaxID=1344949 RepID=A0A923HHU9_9BURK|nr:hypothetical protein [Undibacterium jejuense]MBC3864331.1 hypothetical protein [Undibacterium jejuense]